MPPEIATLQEPFGNAVLATSDIDLAGETVAVLGCGPIGLFTIAICRAAGAARILASDRSSYRLQLALLVGADAVLDVSTVDHVPGWFADAGRGEGVDVVFEMSGAPTAVADACVVARNGGRVVLFGLPPRPVELPLAESVICKNLLLQGVHGRRIFDTWHRTRVLLESGAIDLTPLISHRLEGLDGVQDALKLLSLGEACKVIVYPNARTTNSRCGVALATA
jgi:threonine 3-dehydrogenase